MDDRAGGGALRDEEDVEAEEIAAGAGVGSTKISILRVAGFRVVSVGSTNTASFLAAGLSAVADLESGFFSPNARGFGRATGRFASGRREREEAEAEADDDGRVGDTDTAERVLPAGPGGESA